MKISLHLVRFCTFNCRIGTEIIGHHRGRTWAIFIKYFLKSSSELGRGVGLYLFITSVNPSTFAAIY